LEGLTVNGVRVSSTLGWRVAFDPPKPPAQDGRDLSTDPLASLGALAAVSGNIDPIQPDMGGVIVDYVKKYSNIRGSGEKVIIDGDCVSACIGIVPKQNVSITENAVLGFHSATVKISPDAEPVNRPSVRDGVFCFF
jgi:hypothetical protein